LKNPAPTPDTNRVIQALKGLALSLKGRSLVFTKVLRREYRPEGVEFFTRTTPSSSSGSGQGMKPFVPCPLLVTPLTERASFEGSRVAVGLSLMGEAAAAEGGRATTGRFSLPSSTKDFTKR